MRYILLLLIPLMLTCCKTMKENDTNQGITGTVRWFEGNLMPGPGRPAPQGSLVKRTIVICGVTNMSELNGDAPLFENTGDKVITEVTSGDNGEFTVKLPPGKYSVFTKEKEGFFANGFDAENNVGVVTVEENKMTDLQIDINYKASY